MLASQPLVPAVVVGSLILAQPEVAERDEVGGISVAGIQPMEAAGVEQSG
jgi:hypothetical protein